MKWGYISRNANLAGAKVRKCTAKRFISQLDHARERNLLSCASLLRDFTQLVDSMDYYYFKNERHAYCTLHTYIPTYGPE
eukprot:scaffold1123_cov56-Cylindrotheca_fusiformis.AAC.2